MSKPEYFLDMELDDELDCAEDCHACKNYHYCREVLRNRFNLEYPEIKKSLKKAGAFMLPIPSAGCDTANIITNLSPGDHIQIRNNLMGTDDAYPENADTLAGPVFQSLNYGSDSPNTIVLLPVDLLMP